MADWYDMYQKHMNVSGRTPRETNFKHKKQDFEFYFGETTTYALVKLLMHNNKIKEMGMAFVDHSKSNNKDLSDDKYITANIEDNFDVGDYVFWQNDVWIIFTKEFKTVQINQTGKIKNANQNIKWIRDGKIINNEVGYYAYVQSQTQYTMGMSETTYLDIPDGKMLMYMQDNKDTRQIKTNERIFIDNKVYKVKHMDGASRSGLISYLMDQDRVDTVYDNVELGVADYYRYYNKNDDFSQHVDEEEEEELPIENINTIDGDAKPKIGTTHTYTSKNKVVDWFVESIDMQESFTIIEHDEHSIRIEFKNEYFVLGDKVNIIARDEFDNYTTLTIIITKKY